MSPPDGNGNGITILQKDDQSNYNTVGYLYMRSPTSMMMDARQDFIYAVNELNDYDQENGLLYALRVAHPSGNLAIANSAVVNGWKPCYVTLDPSDRYILIANCGSGNVIVYSLTDIGTIGSVTSNVAAPGCNTPSDAQANMVSFDPKGDYVAVVYTGLDSIYFYTLDNDGHLNPYDIYLSDGTSEHVRAEVDPGSGPRHLVYSQNGEFFYVINEWTSTVSVFKAEVDLTTATYPLLQVISVHPENYNGSTWAYELAIHPNGMFLYASDRNDSTITTYSIDQESGLLTPIDYQPTTGEEPWFIMIEPSGNILYATNEKDNNIDVFSINATGHLNLEDTIENIPSPVFMLYAELFYK